MEDTRLVKMDLLTTPPTDEQQELSARALRACLAAEAALASLRAECLPLRSSLPKYCDSGSRNLELAHRSLQLQIEACESFTLCATAAFKQLCDSHFLLCSGKGSAVKLVHRSTTSETEYCTLLPCTQKSEGDSRVSKSNAETDNHDSTARIQTQEEAPTIFGNSSSSQISSDSEEAQCEARSPMMLMSAPNSGSRSSISSDLSNQITSRECTARMESSHGKLSKDFAARLGFSLSKASRTNKNTVKRSSVGPLPVFSYEPKEAVIKPFEGPESLVCSSSKERAMNVDLAPSDFSLKNGLPIFQLSESEAATTEYLLPMYTSSPSSKEIPAHRSSLSWGTSSIMSSKESTMTDQSFPVHKQEDGSGVIHNRVPKSASHLSCLAGDATDVSTTYGGSEVSFRPPSQPYTSVNNYSSGASHIGLAESPAASKGCRTVTSQLSPALIGIVSTTPPTLSDSGQEGYSQSAVSLTTLGVNHKYKRDGLLHFTPYSSASPSDSSFGSAINVDSLELEQTQAGESNSNDGYLQDPQGLDSTSSLGLSTCKRGWTYFGSSTSLNMQFPQTTLFDNNHTGVYVCRNSGSRASAKYGQPSPISTGTVISSASLTYQTGPYSRMFEAQRKSASEQPSFGCISFAGKFHEVPKSFGNTAL